MVRGDYPGLDDVKTVSERITQLRKLMCQHNLDFYIVPSEDAHSSEYTSPSDFRRGYISGFTGSAGVAVIGHDVALLFTDSRYFNQANNELDSSVYTLMKQGLPTVPSWQNWIAEKSSNGTNVGIDPSTITFGDAIELRNLLSSKASANLIAVKDNLVDSIWGSVRPAREKNPVIIQPEKFAGESLRSKIDGLRKFLQKNGAYGIIISMLDEVAWTLNLRGSDVPYNPVFFSYLAVYRASTCFYVNQDQLDSDVLTHLGESVDIRPYDSVFEDATVRSKSLKSEEKILMTDKGSWALAHCYGESNVRRIRSPVMDAKCIKNELELRGMIECHKRDGAALVKYLCWLEKALRAGSKLDEVTAADQLENYRREQENFVGLSFPTISAFGGNASMPHYGPSRGNCATLGLDEIYLCDSGAQFRDGTTDVTRTYIFTEPAEGWRENYTLVLKGHIAIARAIFPEGTTGYRLDCLARQFLWRRGLDYGHGTGHGVGSFLNVHEPPVGIGLRKLFDETAIKPGMVISNEPGFYVDGKYGIRIENLVYVKKASEISMGSQEFYQIENLTLAPLCKRLIDVGMLTLEERDYIDTYHKQVYENLKPLLKNDLETMQWLQEETSPLN